MSEHDGQQFTNKEAARMLSITDSWLRQLELRGALPAPRRAGTYRIYSEQEIKRLARILEKQPECRRRSWPKAVHHE